MRFTFVSRHIQTTGGTLLLADALALLSAISLACGIRLLSNGSLPMAKYLKLSPFIGGVLLLYWMLGLYPGNLLLPHKELKRLSQGTTLGFLFLSFVFFLGQQGIVFSRLVLLASWFLALFFVPAGRYICRALFSHKDWWGSPVVLFSPPEAARTITDTRMANNKSRLRVVAIIPISPDGEVLGSPENLERELHEIQRRYSDACACIIADHIPSQQVQKLLLRFGKYFRRLAIRPDSDWMKQSSLHVAQLPFGHVLTMHQNLLDPNKMRIKRVLDLALCIPFGLACLLLLPCIALWIRLDSKGPIFYHHERLGLDGRNIRVWKFRTMFENADTLLGDSLRNDPDKHREWQTERKLEHDPRLTRAGSFLRRTSLDELPQIYNVLTGEMSFVGPRPVVADEIPLYGDRYELLNRVRPGITGLWQVSGRNDTGYARRVELDQYYVHNWSVWLDIYIILRTVPVVLSGKGAY
ncbi:MAG: undecaprenyl-phosphate galactose phosphotransferase WbaP [Desulfovibrio sp.]|jgi:Undecaprenyl-phosphate galactose phosphotransferase WbaP|nr:undecaprenyl-phosphate galactose phosphotransferase WbaP [Desulfovibrio sp.]